MNRVLSIDFGKKRSGIAVTDPLQIAVHGLAGIETKDLLSYLIDYCKTETVEKIVFGLPLHADGNETHLKKDIDLFISKMKKVLPNVEVDFQDEFFTSRDALDIMIQAGVKKKQRRDKNKIDQLSAVLILQRYLNHI
jgi:putative Holliday junction resolvase